MVQNVYTDCFITEIGCILYLDALGKSAAPAGKYSDGNYCYTVNSFGIVTAINLCGETTTTTSTSTTSTSTTSTSTTSTTSTSTSTSTTTTTTAAPAAVAINYRIAIPATGTYNYSFTPYSASIFPASYYSPTSSGVLSVINDSTRYAFSPSQSFTPGASIAPILFNAISGSFICDAGLLPYVTESAMIEDPLNTLCSGFSNKGTGSIVVVSCFGGGGPAISANSEYSGMVGRFPTPTSGSSINPTASFFANGTFNPNPYPTKAGGLYNQGFNTTGSLYKYLNVVVYSPGYATQSLWIPTGTVTQLNGVPIVAGTKVQYWQNTSIDYNQGFGGTKTQVDYNNNQYLWIHTYTASGDFTYRFQNEF
jgi:hypothetical protein